MTTAAFVMERVALQIVISLLVPHFWILGCWVDLLCVFSES